MSKVRKLIPLLIVVGLIAGYLVKKDQVQAYVKQATFVSYCNRKIYYSVEEIDPQFKTTKQEVLDAANNSASIWNSAIGHEVFVYKDTGDLDINLRYDERQQLITTIAINKAKVEKEKQVLEKSISDYEKTLNTLNMRINKLNDEIDYWNNKGGAPTDQYNKIKKEISDTQAEIQSSNAKRNELLKSTDALNNQIDELNQKASEFNRVLEAKPEEGVYTSGIEKIDIFFYQDEDSFQHTLTHEMGHALGLEHSEDETSIMYPVTNTQSTLSASDKTYLQDFCTQRNMLTDTIQRAVTQIKSYIIN